MDFVRQQLAVVQERLAALSASQKMLTAALAVILVMTMLYWGRLSATPDRVAVTPAALAGEDLANVTAALRSAGIDYTVDAGKVMVAADKQLEAMGNLTFNQALPAGSSAFDKMFETVSPWDSQGAFDVRVVNAKQQTMSAVMRQWPGVKKADIMITDAPNSALSRREPRMAISIQTKGGDVERRKLAAAARNYAMGCVSGLSEKFISINVDAMAMSADSGGGMDGGDLLDRVRRYEGEEVEKIRGRLAWIPGVLVQVTAEIDNSTKSVNQHVIDKKDAYEALASSTHKTSTPVAAPQPPQEPGVVANTNLDIRANGGGPAGPSGTATEEETLTNNTDVGRTDTVTSSNGGGCKVIGATVGVPQSVLDRIWHKQHPKADPDAQPPEDEYKKFVADVLADVRASVRSLTLLKTDDEISVRDFYDLDPVMGGPVLAAASPSAASNLTLLATGHARELAIGVLAVTSLFMVSRMVKKAAPSQLTLAGAGGLNLMVADDDVPIVPKRKVPPKVIGGEEVAAEVGDTGAIMFGQEIDADVLETSQMIEQVAGFVKDNPDAAAQMIGRWMSRD